MNDADRRDAALKFWTELGSAKKVALSTHVGADGDGCGSQAAFALVLAQKGLSCFIVNPTPWPEMFRYLLGDDVVDRSAEGAAAIASADRIVVLDISDVSRLGVLADAVRSHPKRALVIDHHMPGTEPPGDVMLSDVTACATGELVYDLAVAIGAEITPAVATALYTAILTDTGGFRFSNTSPRCHAVAAELLRAGVDPQAMYRRIYAAHSLGRMHLLRDALTTLGVDQAIGLAWIDIAAGSLEKYGLTSEDLDGIAEYPRSIAGTRIAVLFRDLGHGKVKVSFRSTDADVNALARRFGGGGHARASGALITGSLDEVKSQVLAAARELLSHLSSRSD
jgi:phosphoesterase RecJ-like protein